MLRSHTCSLDDRQQEGVHPDQEVRLLRQNTESQLPQRGNLPGKNLQHQATWCQCGMQA